MEGSSGWDGENQLVKETWVSLSTPVRLNILVTYWSSSASAATPPAEPAAVAELVARLLGMLMMSRVASSWGVLRLTCCCSCCCLYVWLVELDNCDHLRFDCWASDSDTCCCACFILHNALQQNNNIIISLSRENNINGQSTTNSSLLATKNNFATLEYLIFD